MVLSEQAAELSEREPQGENDTMDQWQKDVLNSRYLTVDDTDRLKIYKLSNDKYAMSIGQIIDIIRASKKKPLIMNPSVPFSGKFAQKREVLNELKKRI